LAVTSPHGHRPFPSTVLDCPDPAGLARFYGAMLGWTVEVDPAPTWAEIKAGHGQTVFLQQVTDDVAPTCPGQDAPSRCTST